MKRLPLHSILVVDDEESYRGLLKTYLEEIGFVCHTAKDAFEADHIIQENTFHLVVCDIVMPDKNGLDLMKEVRKERPQIDFILMTGFSQHDYSEIIHEGAIDFIKKPFELKELKAKIERRAREIESSERIQSLSNAFEKEAKLNESFANLSQLLLTSRTVYEISELVMEHARMLTESPIAFADYLEPETGHFVCRSPISQSSQFRPEGLKGPVFETSTSLWDWGLIHKKPWMFNSVATDSRFSHLSSDRVPIERFLSAPALAGEQLLGQLAVGNAHREYDSADLSIIERLANIYALAIKRNLLEEGLKANNLALKKEIERRIIVEKELATARNQLEELLDARTAKLNKAGEIMKRSIEVYRSIA